MLPKQAELYCFLNMGILAGKFGRKGGKKIIFHSTCLLTDFTPYFKEN